MAVATGLVAVALMPIAYSVRKAKKEQELIQQVRNLGGTVWYAKLDGSEGLGSRGTNFLPRFQAMTSKLLGHEDGSLWQKADMVSFVGFQGDANQLELIARLASVRELDFVHAHVSPELIEVAMRMPNLQRLNLSDTDVDDRALDRLVTKPNLQYLNIMGSRATPEAVQAFCDARPDCKLSVAPDTEFMTWLNRLFEEQSSATQRPTSSFRPTTQASD